MTPTIKISKETKEMINTFRRKEETYEDVIKRMYDLTVKKQLRDFLMSSEGTVTIDEAIEWVNKKNKKLKK